MGQDPAEAGRRLAPRPARSLDAKIPSNTTAPTTWILSIPYKTARPISCDADRPKALSDHEVPTLSDATKDWDRYDRQLLRALFRHRLDERTRVELVRRVRSTSSRGHDDPRARRGSRGAVSARSADRRRGTRACASEGIASV